MSNNSSLYGSGTPPSGSVSSSNYTTLYSGGNNFVPSGDNVIISGTLTVNGCSILTDCSAFNLLPFNATTVSAFGAATAVSIGGATGVTTIQNQLSTANYLFPLADGSANQVLITDGAGILSFADVQSLDTNYTINASTTSGGANFNLVGSDATTDTITFAEGSGMNIVRTDANTITFNNISPGTTYTQNASATTGGANLNLVGSDATIDPVKFASGTGITVSRTDADTITITNTGVVVGVTSITGTTNQVIASSPTGAVTLSLPQDIATTSGPTFASVTAGNIRVGGTTDNTIDTTTGALILASATNAIDASTTTITAGAVTIGSSGTIDNQATTTTSTTTVQINFTNRNGMKAVISVVDNVTGARHILEALLFKQGTNAYLTTYAEMYSSAALATFSADVNAGNLRLLATPASTNSTTFETIRTSIN
jgi:hypothetical protein